MGYAKRNMDMLKSMMKKKEKKNWTREGPSIKKKKKKIAHIQEKEKWRDDS
jgi:hypothetical protein